MATQGFSSTLNLDITFDTGGLKKLGKLLDNIANNKRFDKLWMSQEQAIDKLLIKAEQYKRVLASGDTNKIQQFQLDSGGLLNTLRVLSGLKDNETIDFNKISESLEDRELSAREKAILQQFSTENEQAINSNPILKRGVYTAGEIKEAYEAMALMTSEKGMNLPETEAMKMLGSYAESSTEQVAALNTEIAKLNSENEGLRTTVAEFENGGQYRGLQEDLDATKEKYEAATRKAQRYQYKLEDVYDANARRFTNLLESRGVYPENFYPYSDEAETYDNYYNQLLEGYMTDPREALDRFRSEYTHLFEEGDIGASALEGFTSALERLEGVISSADGKLDLLAEGLERVKAAMSSGGGVEPEVSELEQLGTAITEASGRTEGFVQGETQITTGAQTASAAIETLAATMTQAMQQAGTSDLQGAVAGLVEITNAANMTAEEMDLVYNSIAKVIGAMQELTVQAPENALQFMSNSFKQLQTLGTNGISKGTVNNVLTLTQALSEMHQQSALGGRIDFSGLESLKSIEGLKISDTLKHITANAPAITSLAGLDFSGLSSLLVLNDLKPSKTIERLINITENIPALTELSGLHFDLTGLNIPKGALIGLSELANINPEQIEGQIAAIQATVKNAFSVTEAAEGELAPGMPIPVTITATKDATFEEALAEIAALKDTPVSIVINASEESNIGKLLEDIQLIRGEENIPINITVHENSNITTVLEQIEALRRDSNVMVTINGQQSQALTTAIAELNALKNSSHVINVTIEAQTALNTIETIKSELTAMQDNPTKITISLSKNGLSEKSITDLKDRVQAASDAFKNFTVGEFTSKLGEARGVVTEITTDLKKLNQVLQTSVGLSQGFSIKGITAQNIRSIVDEAQKGNSTIIPTPTQRADEPKTKFASATQINNLRNRIQTRLSELNEYKSNEFISGYDTKHANFISELQSLESQLNASDLTVDQIKNIRETLSILNTNNKNFKTQSRLNNILLNGGTNDKLGQVVSQGLQFSDNGAKNRAIAEEALKNSGVYNSVKSIDWDSESHGIATVTDSLNKLQKVNVNLSKSFGTVRTSFAEVVEPAGIINTTLDALGTKAKQLGAYFTSMMAFMFVWQQFREGIEIIKEMDKAFFELHKVSNETAKTYAEVWSNALEVGSKVGANAIELTKSTADYMRSGFSDINDAQELAKSTAVLLNTSEFESMDEATTAMVSIVQGFGKTAKDADSIVDTLNAVGDTMPIAVDGIATALEKSSSALASKGTSFEQSTALIAAGNAVVQNPNTVGAGLRTIALRLTGTETERNQLKDEGEDVEGMITSTSKLRDEIKGLTAVASNAYKGFDILKDDGSYKNTYEILLGIAEIWEEIGKGQNGSMNQSALLEDIAGKTRSNIAASIFQNPEMLKEAYANALNSAGTGERENAAFLDSIEGRIVLLKNALQSMWTNAINSDVLKFFVDLGTAIVKIVDNVGALNSIFLALGAYMAIKNNGPVHYTESGQLVTANGKINDTFGLGKFKKLTAPVEEVETIGDPAVIEEAAEESVALAEEKIAEQIVADTEAAVQGTASTPAIKEAVVESSTNVENASKAEAEKLAKKQQKKARKKIAKNVDKDINNTLQLIEQEKTAIAESTNELNTIIGTLPSGAASKVTSPGEVSAAVAEVNAKAGELEQSVVNKINAIGNEIQSHVGTQGKLEGELSTKVGRVTTNDPKYSSKQTSKVIADFKRSSENIDKRISNINSIREQLQATEQTMSETVANASIVADNGDVYVKNAKGKNVYSAQITKEFKALKEEKDNILRELREAIREACNEFGVSTDKIDISGDTSTAAEQVISEVELIKQHIEENLRNLQLIEEQINNAIAEIEANGTSTVAKQGLKKGTFKPEVPKTEQPKPANTQPATTAPIKKETPVSSAATEKKPDVEQKKVEAATAIVKAEEEVIKAEQKAAETAEVTATTETALGKARQAVNNGLTKTASTFANMAASAGKMAVSMMANVGIMLAFSMAMKAVMAAIEGIKDSTINATKIAIENAKEVEDTYGDRIKTNQDNLKSLKDIKDEYNSLSAGVDSRGNNISLDTSDYQRFLELRQQILEMSPDLIAGYDAEGRAYTNSADLVKDAAEIQKKERLETAKERVSGKNLTDLSEGYKAMITDSKGSWFDHVVNADYDTADKKFRKFVKNVAGSSKEFNKVVADITGITGVDWTDTDNLSTAEMETLAKNWQSVYTNLSDSTKKSFAQANADVDMYVKHIAENSASVKESVEQFKTVLGYLPASVDEFYNLSEAQQSFFSGLMANWKLDEKALDADPTQYVNNVKDKVSEMISSFSENDKAQVDLNNLIKLSTDGSIKGKDWVNQIQGALDQTAKDIGLDSDQKGTLALTVGLGFDASGNLLKDGKNVSDMYYSVFKGIMETVSDNDKAIQDMTNNGIDSFIELASSAEVTADGARELSDATIELGLNTDDTSAAIEYLSELSIDDLTMAFDILNDNAKTANGTTREFTGTLEQLQKRIELIKQSSDIASTFQEYQKAVESPNAGAKYLSMDSALDQVKQDRDAGLIGTDEFKAFTSMLTGGKESVEAFDKSYSKFKKYFTTDHEGPQKFLQDLSKINNEDGSSMASLDKATNQWKFNIKDLTSLSKQLGIGLEPLEAMLNRLKDYGFDVNFESYVDNWQKATNEVDKLQDVWSKLDEGAGKSELGEEIEDYRQQIIKAQQASEEIPDKVIKEIEFKITVVEEQAKLDNLEALYDQQLSEGDISGAQKTGKKMITQSEKTNSKYKGAAEKALKGTKKEKSKAYTDKESSMQKEVSKARKSYEDALNDPKIAKEDLAKAKKAYTKAEDNYRNFYKQVAETPEEYVTKKATKKKPKQTFKTKGLNKDTKRSVEGLNSVLSEIETNKVDTDKTQFGNINTNKRQKLYWTKANKKANGKAAKSYGIDVNEFSKEDYSTLLGMYNNFGKKEIPIAFTPMLQTSSGKPKMLDAKIMDKYLNTIVDKCTDSKGNVDFKDILKLDAEGMEIDGEKIKNVIADVGKTAEQTASMMHFTGNTGALQAEKESVASSFKENYNIDLDVNAEDFSAKLNEAIKIASANIDTSSLESTLSGLTDLYGKGNVYTLDVDADTSAAIDAIDNVEVMTIGDKKFAVVTNGDKDAISKIGKVDGAKIDNKSFSITANATKATSTISGIKSLLSTIKDKTVSITTKYKTQGKQTVPVGGGSLTVSKHPKVNGTAHAQGTIGDTNKNIKDIQIPARSAHADGNWSLPKNETALVNELGREILVRNGQFTLLPGGAHFEKLRKGDIIFNHKQSAELLKNGFVTSNNGHGKVVGSFAGGTFASDEEFEEYFADQISYALGTVTGSARGTKVSGGGAFNTKKTSSSSSKSKSSSKSSKSSSKSKKKNSSKKKKSSSKKKKQNAFEKWVDTLSNLFDFIEIKLQRLEETTDRWLSKAAIASDLAASMYDYGKAISSVTSSIDANEKAADKYTAKYKSIETTALSKNTKKRTGVTDGTLKSYFEQIRNGSFNITNIKNDSLRSVLKDYQDWYDKAQKCSDAVLELKKQQKELVGEKLNAVLEHYDAYIDRLQSVADYYETYEKYLEAAGLDSTSSKTTAYNNQITQQKQILSQQKNELAQYMSEFESNKGYLSEKEQQEYLKQIEVLKAGIYETQTTIAELNNSIFDLKVNNLERLTDEAKHTADALQQIAEVSSAHGDYATEDSYQKQIDANNKAWEAQQSLIDAYKAEMATVAQGSDRWNELKDALRDAIDEQKSLELSNEELRQSIIDLRFEQADREINKRNTRISDNETLIDLIGKDNLTDVDTGKITTDGLAVASLISDSITQHEKNIVSYKKEKEALNALYKSGQIGAEKYNEKLDELNQAIQDEALSVKDLNDELLDMAKEGMQAEYDALVEIIDLRKDALNRKKEYYDYDKTIKSSNKNIEALKAERAALEGVEGAAAAAQRARLDAQISEAQEDLSDVIQNHQFELESTAYDDLTEKLSKALEKQMKLLASSLDAQAQAIANLMNSVAQNFDQVFTKINATIDNAAINGTFTDSEKNDYSSVTTGKNTQATNNKVLSNVNNTSTQVNGTNNINSGTSISSSTISTGKTSTTTVADVDKIASQVQAKKEILAFTLSATSISMTYYTTKTINVTSVTPSDAPNQTFTWSVSGAIQMTSSSSGKSVTVKGIKVGSGTITCKSANGVTATCSVTVSLSDIQKKVQNNGATLLNGEIPNDSNAFNDYLASKGFKPLSNPSGIYKLAKGMGIITTSNSKKGKTYYRKTTSTKFSSTQLNNLLTAIKKAGLRKGGIIDNFTPLSTLINDAVSGNGDHGIATVRRDEMITSPEGTKDLLKTMEISKELFNKYVNNNLTDVGSGDYGNVYYESLIKVESGGVVDKSVLNEFKAIAKDIYKQEQKARVKEYKKTGWKPKF